jgi:1,2-diacylglycerol 3-alpha-glucosyltransferase
MESSDPLLRLDLAGDGVERPALEALVDRLGLGDVVRFLGNVSYDEMPRLFADHDLFVHASLHEAQGMVMLEALATGLPVIASDTGIAHSLPESLLYRFTPGNPRELAGAIVRSLSDTRHAAAAADAGPALIRSEYALEIVRQRFIELYRSLQD